MLIGLDSCRGFELKQVTAFCNGSADFIRKGCHVVSSSSVNDAYISSSEPLGCPGYVHGNIASADYNY